MTWLVTANTNSCRIFQYDEKPHPLTLVKELFHGDSKLKDGELSSDRPGHYHIDNFARGAYSQHAEPKAVEIENFSREIAKELDKGRRSNQYKSLILAIPSHMNGLLHQHLDAHVKKCIVNNIVKDYTHLKATEILDALNKDIES